MIDFIKKNQKNLTMGLALSVLVLCYFQRKEINRLRNDEKAAKEINLDSIKIQSDELIKDSLKWSQSPKKH